MHNGIGLQTPRGSGTSGHVQANKFLAKPRAPSASGGGGTPNPPPTGSGLDGMQKPNKDMLEHGRKRQVELRLVELRDELEEQGYTEAEIEERVEEERKAIEAEGGPPRAQDKRFTDKSRYTMLRHGRRTSFRVTEYEVCSWTRCSRAEDVKKKEGM